MYSMVISDVGGSRAGASRLRGVGSIRAVAAESNDLKWKSVATMGQTCRSMMDCKNICSNDVQAAAGSIKSITYSWVGLGRNEAGWSKVGWSKRERNDRVKVRRCWKFKFKKNPSQWAPK